MRGKIVLLYETERGKALCDIASYVLTQVAVAFGHALTLPEKRCEQAAEVSDEIIDLCADAEGILVGDGDMACLPALTDELLCASRLRELRYSHLIENRSLMGPERPLNAILLQALNSLPETLQATANLAYAVSARENLPILQVPPSGKLAAAWQSALEQADSLSAPFHAWELPLARVLPDMIFRPQRTGVLLCPPYAGSVLADAAAALAGAQGMGYDVYIGGQCGLLAALKQDADALNPFGFLRAVTHLLRSDMKLDKEAACVEAALRNVLQAGWRTADIALQPDKVMDAEGICDLVCQQIEVAGEWITNG